MRTKEEIIIEVFGKNGGIHGLLYRNQNYIEYAMQLYAEEYHQSELLKLNKSDVSNRGGAIPFESLSDSFKETINSIENNLNK